MKSFNFKLLIPASKHKTSSGNNGKINANDNNNFPLLFIIWLYFKIIVSLKILLTNFKPKTFPNKNAINEPIITPIEQNNVVSIGPYIKFPHIINTIDGIGNITTWPIDNIIKITIPIVPKDNIKFFNFVTELKYSNNSSL